jgi:hypothetical protein
MKNDMFHMNTINHVNKQLRYVSIWFDLVNYVMVIILWTT